MTIQPLAALPEQLVIGVLGKLSSARNGPKLTIIALQGAFIEHIHYVERYVPFPSLYHSTDRDRIRMRTCTRVGSPPDFPVYV